MDSTLSWIKSSFSFANGNCIQVAALPDGSVAIRNSKDPEGPQLHFDNDEWTAFLAGVEAGEFSRI